MLPRLLCEELCSLNPATDRLTFSVIWRVNSDGEVLDEWFGRTVINSAVKLSYEHAQMFIDSPPDTHFDTAVFPVIRPAFDLNAHIKPAVLQLNQLAVRLRQKRFAAGCLALNQAKLSFVLNREAGGLPYGYHVYEQRDSNRLVEEFMLLANIAVARKIYQAYPSRAILRRHPLPNSKQLEQLGDSLRVSGYEVCDVSSSRAIQEFLARVESESTDPVALLTLTCLLSKTMQLAQYFCSGIDIEREQFYHYGLAVPLYTHFTSPIRRYPDILVHRLLAASLGEKEAETRRDAKHLQSIAENCNDKKYAARVCSERSGEMFFSLFVHVSVFLFHPGLTNSVKKNYLKKLKRITLVERLRRLTSIYVKSYVGTQSNSVRPFLVF
jgi:DIS3-like exonuclease 2